MPNANQSYKAIFIAFNLFLPACFGSCDAMFILADCMAAPLVLLSLQYRADSVVQKGSTPKPERICQPKQNSNHKKNSSQFLFCCF